MLSTAFKVNISSKFLQLVIRRSIMADSNLCHVFVYGTLKNGEPNHHWLTDAANGEAEFVTHAQTIVEFPLVIASKYNIPFLLNAPGVGKVSIIRIHEK